MKCMLKQHQYKAFLHDHREKIETASGWGLLIDAVDKAFIEYNLEHSQGFRRTTFKSIDDTFTHISQANSLWWAHQEVG